MPAAYNFFNKTASKRPLYVQIMFTIFAFSIMVILSYVFMYKTINRYLVQNSEIILDMAQTQIISDLIEPQAVLENVSRITRTMILRGDSAGRLQEYLIVTLTDLLLDNHRNAVYSTLFGYFETLPGGPVFMEGLVKDMADWYRPTERSWYQNAVAANGEIAETMIYRDEIYEKPVLIFSICIFDDDGRRLGAVGIRIEIDGIGKFVTQTAMTHNGYGVLLSEDLVVLAHQNYDYVGKKIHELEIPIKILANDLQNGKEIMKRPVVSYKNENAVSFFRKIPNGWYLGVVTPKNLYYQSAVSMAVILNILGITLAGALIYVLICVDAARNKADMENRQKSAFLANMSHEIRTPMNAIIGMTDILLNEPLNKRQAGFVNDIKVSSHLLLSIINDILDVSKIESGKLALNPVNYDFHTFMDNIVSMFSYIAQKKSLEFKFESEGEIPDYLFGDDIRLRQVLTNICGNAVKYTEKGYVKLKITAADNTLKFEVKDSGMGIRERDIPKLFNVFERAETEKNRGIVGTGLGLSICKSFVEMMGGKITVDSKYERGSVFTVIIPYVSGSKADVKLDKKLTAGHTLYAPAARILVVDDNDFNLKVAEGLLGLLKIKPQMASSGREAVNLIQKNTYDLVFMDHMMPEMDGVETTAQIRKLGNKYKNLPVIALTANAVQGAKEMFLSSGFNGFISKPIDLQEMCAILKEWLPPDKIGEEETIGEKTEESRLSEDNRLLNALNKISEINTEIGMDLVSGMENMYCETLEIFTKKMMPECDAMSAKINNGDINGFSISIHAMKSALAVIGAMGLSDAALKLEMAAKKNDVEYCVQQFPVLKNKMINLHKELSAVFLPAETAVKKKSGDMSYLKENIEKALAAASEFDGEAGLNIINDLLTYDFGEQNNTALENAAAAFNNFNYDAAAEFLDKLKK
jgi:signal transduction histidine kinase/CheY-like chemotaxis protein